MQAEVRDPGKEVGGSHKGSRCVIPCLSHMLNKANYFKHRAFHFPQELNVPL